MAFVGYDKSSYDKLQQSISSYKNSIVKKINSIDGVITSLTKTPDSDGHMHWEGADADNYVKGLSSNFADTYNEWVKKQNS